MKRFLIISFILITATCWSQQDSTKEFRVWIEVAGAKRPSSTRVLLRKRPFDIVVQLNKGNAVLVHASHDKKTWKRAKKGKPMEELPGFIETGMAEGSFNEDNVQKRGMLKSF